VTALQTGTVQETAKQECASTSNRYSARNSKSGVCQHFKQVLWKEQHTRNMPELPKTFVGRVQSETGLHIPRDNIDLEHHVFNYTAQEAL
jgi:hypothetical protein